LTLDKKRAFRKKANDHERYQSNQGEIFPKSCAAKNIRKCINYINQAMLPFEEDFGSYFFWAKKIS